MKGGRMMLGYKKIGFFYIVLILRNIYFYFKDYEGVIKGVFSEKRLQLGCISHTC